ncbi:M28 family peptidase, partial [Myxococcota bacterium]|nr:M28 family peptidase [Myxococcota bacterium]
PVPASRGHNILGRIPGRGRHAERAILVAAHYDHLGTRNGAIYRGADDNAAAVAILVEAAARIAARAGELGRQVIVASFDAEEPPNYLADGMGSMHWVRSPTVPLDRVDTMICMDLMGHAIGSAGMPDAVRSSVFVLGAERSPGTDAIVDAVGAKQSGVVLRRVASEVIPPMSDYAAFEEAEVPFLFLTSGRWRYYHTPEDTPDKLDYSKMLAATDALVELTIECSSRPAPRVDYHALGRDDLATLASLRGLATSLAPLAGPMITPFLAQLDALDRSARRSGTLDAAERHTLTELVALVESALAG